MKKVTLNGYTFQYTNNMLYFNDQRYNNVLFVKLLNKDIGQINAYDGTQVIVQFHQNKVEFEPLWDIKIEQVDAKNYVLRPLN